ncbi:MAG TPA: hypothetical protein VFP54_01200 [Acidimicrobiales bacterium]|nr:hypothetical protein [Acidimicrobiales bacterium]
MGEQRRGGVLLLDEPCECGSTVPCVAGLVLPDVEALGAAPVLDAEETVRLLGSAGLAAAAAAVGRGAEDLNRCPECGDRIERLGLAEAVEELRSEGADLVELAALWVRVDGDELAGVLAARYE